MGAARCDGLTVARAKKRIEQRCGCGCWYVRRGRLNTVAEAAAAVVVPLLSRRHRAALGARQSRACVGPWACQAPAAAGPATPLP